MKQSFSARGVFPAIVFAVFVFAMSSCKDDVANAGASSLQDTDDICVLADTFPLSSSIAACEAITMTADSFLLGECDTHYGTIKADILTQLACPTEFEYPYVETAVVDSVCLYMYYQNWYGDGLAPMGITVYEMDRSTLQYNSRYPSDTALTEFCSLSDSSCLTTYSRIIIPARPTDSTYSESYGGYVPYIKLRLSDQFAKRFFSVRDFSSQENFNQLFKGLYITSDFGGSSILYVTDISMAVFYHFTYPTSEGGVLTNDIKMFYANAEVRQINRYIYPDREDILQKLSAVQDTNFVVAPANIYTKLTIPLNSIYQKIDDRLVKADDYRVYVNRANLTVDVLYNTDNTSSRPRNTWDSPANYMLLIKQENFHSFFAKNELPSDTSAILGTLTVNVDSVGNTNYSYSYDLSSLLTAQLRSEKRIEQLNFMLIPVTVTTSSSSSTTVTAVKQQQTISATCIRSANNSVEPMDIEMVYSGFNKTRR